ncbi:MAG: methyltransferase domain-containing protein [Inquilinus sp.]|nr:methyltransferase domain-containing protein [Inquilinus sp.]
MYTDVVDLREFYGSSLGHVAQRMIRRRVRALWPDLQGQILLGLGFATPYLTPFRDEAERVFAVMPARQGVTRWPAGQPGLVSLADETELPLPDVSVDRVLLVHGAEATENLLEQMREVWRVLAGNGRVLVVVPNRRGIWARSDRTPFGHGRPFSESQLSSMLREHQFVPERVARALYIPPTRSRVLLRAAPAWERVGGRFFETFSGVLMIEASKQLYQMSASRRVVRRGRPVLVPVGGTMARRGETASR